MNGEIAAPRFGNGIQICKEGGQRQLKLCLEDLGLGNIPEVFNKDGNEISKQTPGFTACVLQIIV